MKPQTTLLLLMLLCSCLSFGQLPDFTFSVTSQPQTCLGNGSLSFTVSGTQPGAAMAYEVFLLPNTTTPVATVNTATAPNLIAGNYLVVATQTLGSESSEESENVTIEDEVVPLEYVLITGIEGCGNEGTITVDVISGTAVTYEIMAGPVIVAPQASNVFTELTPGLYQVRVYDDCGDAVVVSVQLTGAQANILIQDVIVAGFPDCDTATVTNFYAASQGSEIFWPLTFEYSIYESPSSAPEIITVVVETGLSSGTISTDIPFYTGGYHYDLVVTDACGNTFVNTFNYVGFNPSWELGMDFDPCFPERLKLMNFTDLNFPITVTFEASPDAFDPVAFNPSHPEYDGVFGVNYEQSGQVLPAGLYTVKITDSCGAEITHTIDVPAENDTFILQGLPGECGNGGMKVCMAGKGAELMEFTSGPDGFSDVYPIEIFGELDMAGNIDINSLPPGDYSLHVIDECGNEYFGDFTVTSTGGSNPLVSTMAGCLEGQGSVRIFNPVAGGSIMDVIVEDAPDGFGFELPFDASDHIAPDGQFNMDSLPAGTYTFTVTTECGEFTVEHNVGGYQVTNNNFELTPLCGAFNLLMSHTSTGGNLQSFWLQEYNEETGEWGHPFTGVAYPEGSAPTLANSVMLNNNTTNFSLAYTGQFRVIKMYYSFTDGSVQLQRCLSVIHEFTFSGGPEIIAAYSFPCDDNTAEVALVAEGVPPLEYSITTMNGNPFVVNNGISPHFMGLATGVYNFQVTDDCGNIRNIVFDINTLDPLEITPEGFCVGQDSALLLPDFAFLEYEWWKEGAPGNILGTTNNLLFPDFDPVADSGTYVVHVTATNPGSCIDIQLEYVVTPNENPNAGGDANASLCNEGTAIDLFSYLGEPYDAGGAWSDVNGAGGLEGSTLSTEVIVPGSYQFAYTVTSPCGLTDQAVISFEFMEQPQAPGVAPINPVCEGESIQFEAVAADGAAYHWEGPNGYTSEEQNPLLENVTVAQSGEYSVVVTVPGSDCPSQPFVVAVAVNPGLQFTIEGNSQICEGQTTTLTAVAGNFDPEAVAYEWILDGVPFADTQSIETSQEGTYELFINAGDCTVSQEFVVSNGNDAFEVELFIGCVNFDYMLQVVNLDEIPGATVSWSGPEGFESSETEAVITGFAPGDYIATVTNAEGCSVTATVNTENTACFIPRGVSPNGDGDNDSFDISNLEAQNLQIFNRYGMLVYEKDDYRDEWYGQSEKGNVPTGTYFYMVTLSAGEQITGWVYLQKEL